MVIASSEMKTCVYEVKNGDSFRKIDNILFIETDNTSDCVQNRKQCCRFQPETVDTVFELACLHGDTEKDYFPCTVKPRWFDTD